jgi:oxygen-independent coproporphyrinogen-3 oxidase
MLLYVHVPFCRAKCDYCAFYSVPMDFDLLEVYLDHLEREMDFWGRRRPGTRKVETVYFGGGTPSMLPFWAFERIMARMRDAFTIPAKPEFTFEANPESLDMQLLEGMLELGANRVSIGVQSLEESDLSWLGRPHTPDQAAGAVEMAHVAGYANVGADLIWGLPGQRVGSWLSTIRRLVKLKPHHVSCYGLSVETGTLLHARSLTGDLGLPAEEEQGRIFLRGADFLEAEGYLQYEISNFAKLGMFSRHNTGYWQGKDYLGLGPSAVSTLDGIRWKNPADVHAWAGQARTGRLARSGEKLDPQTRAAELVMLSLRTTQGLSLKKYKEAAGTDFQEQHKRLLTGLRQHGLIRLGKGRVSLTRQGMLVANSILERFLAPLGREHLADDRPQRPGLPSAGPPEV